MDGMALDPESREALQAVAASEAGLPVGLSSRVAGTTISQMREDAQRLALDAGYAEPPEQQPRNERGQFARGESGHQQINSLIREAAGYPAVEQHEQPPQGTIGIGTGRGALPRESRAQPSMNAIIRNSVAASRGLIPIEQIAQEGPL
jgi:hypothetical protein